MAEGMLARIEADLQQQTVEHTAQWYKSFVEASQPVGWVYSMGYDEARVLIHDYHRRAVGGIPALSFLLATAKREDDGLDYNHEDSAFLLLRVLDSAPLPDDPELERVRIDAAQRAADPTVPWDSQENLDPYTAHKLGWAALRCRILGTFYLEPADENNPPQLITRFGSDISNFYSNKSLRVFKPMGEALSAIVNYRDARRVARHPLSPYTIEIGRVRYASADRELPRLTLTSVSLTPADLLNQRSAVFAMTRMGKSNAIKILAEAVFMLRTQDPHKGRIGQLIFDYNGEYANENVQDAGALKNVWQKASASIDEVVTYGTAQHPNDPGRQLLKLNFFHNSTLALGKALLDESLRGDSAQFVKNFVQVDLTEPDRADRSAHTRWRRQALVYKALLAKAGFAPGSITVPRSEARGLFNQKFRDALRNDFRGAAEILDRLESNPDQQPPPQPVSWAELSEACEAIARFLTTDGYKRFNDTYIQQSSSGQNWADASLTALVNMFTQGNGPYRVRNAGLAYHDPTVTSYFAHNIIDHLTRGHLVIVDQSLGNPMLNRAVAERLMWEIFTKQQELFSQSQDLPEVLVYIEEAHNLLPRGSETDLTNVWSRVAKEGAKLRIGLVYATQEVSSIQSNVLKNTANWFIGHLNNSDETRELRKYYDFVDFEQSILRAQDPGFLRVKTLSNPYIVPVQVNVFRAPTS